MKDKLAVLPAVGFPPLSVRTPLRLGWELLSLWGHPVLLLAVQVRQPRTFPLCSWVSGLWLPLP